MFLDQIVTQTRLDLEQRKQERPLEEMMRLAIAQPPPRDLLEAIRPGRSKSQVHLIAEVKRASPSKGLLAPHLDPVELARSYEANGAVVIGINSPDLVTFDLNPSLVRELRQLIPADRVVVAESGIHTAADARRLARYDVQAMLVGESLVKSNDVATQMRSLLQGANES